MSSSWKFCARCTPYPPDTKSTAVSRTPRVEKPGLEARIFCRLCISSPAPTNKTKLSDTWIRTKPERTHVFQQNSSRRKTRVGSSNFLQALHQQSCSNQ